MNKYAKVLFFTLIGTIGFLIIYFYSYYSGFEQTAGSASLTQYENPVIAFDGSQATPVVKKGLRMASECYGFSGECHFDEFGLFLRLEFDGWSGRFPTYQVFNMWGGSTGWALSKRYFGERILTIEKLVISASGKNERVLLARFGQNVWNSSAYDDFSQILAFDLEKKRIFIAQSRAFMAANQMAYEVRFE